MALFHVETIPCINSSYLKCLHASAVLVLCMTRPWHSKSWLPAIFYVTRLGITMNQAVSILICKRPTLGTYIPANARLANAKHLHVDVFLSVCVSLPGCEICPSPLKKNTNIVPEGLNHHISFHVNLRNRGGWVGGRLQNCTCENDRPMCVLGTRCFKSRLAFRVHDFLFDLLFAKLP